jgi:hypothetical protein
MAWYKNDPRYSIGKRADIVILDLALNMCCLAHVDTKNVFSVFTSFAEKPHIAEEDDWPPSWLWCFRPTREDAVERTPDWK